MPTAIKTEITASAKLKAVIKMSGRKGVIQMLRDPELREAYDTLQAFHAINQPFEEVRHQHDELVSITMLLLRGLDKFRSDYLQDLRDFRTVLEQMGTDIAVLQSHKANL